MTAAQFTIEAQARGQEKPSVIITDSERIAWHYFQALVTSEKWDRVKMWNGISWIREWTR